MFTCHPNCELSDFGAIEWLAVLGLFLLVFMTISLFRRWAFRTLDSPSNTLAWHLPKLLYVGVIVLLVTVPPLWFLFGFFGVKMYAQFGFPWVLLVAYLLIPDTDTR